MTRNDNERIAVLETKMDTALDHMDKQDDAMKALHTKLDQIIDGQASGKADRAEMKREMGLIKQDVAEMKPHVETVAHAKTFWSWSGKIGAVMTAIGVAGWSAWDHLRVIAQWMIGKGH